MWVTKREESEEEKNAGTSKVEQVGDGRLGHGAGVG